MVTGERMGLLILAAHSGSQARSSVACPLTVGANGATASARRIPARIMNEFGWLFIALTSTVVAMNVAIVFLVRTLYKRVRRNLTHSGAALRFRARVSSGPRRDVLKLRVRLRETLESGTAAMSLAARSGGPRGELPQLFLRLTSEGDRLDSQLRLLESENDRAVLAGSVPEARQRLDQLAHLVRRLRSVVGDGLGGTSDDSLATLSIDIEREIVAVQTGMQELRDLHGLRESTETGRRSPSNTVASD